MGKKSTLKKTSVKSNKSNNSGKSSQSSIDTQRILDKSQTFDVREKALKVFHTADSAIVSGNYVKFCEIMEDVKKIDPSFTEAYIAEAQVQIMLEEYEKAIPNCDAVLKLKPNDIDALSLKIKSYESMNDIRNTMLCLEQCVEAEQYHYEEISKLIQIYKLAGKHEKIVNLCNKIINSMQDEDEILMIRAAALSQLGKYDEALKDITDAIKINPKSKKYHDLRGYIHEVNNEPKKALEDYKVANNLDKISMMELKLGLPSSVEPIEVPVEEKESKASKTSKISKTSKVSKASPQSNKKSSKKPVKKSNKTSKKSSKISNIEKEEEREPNLFVFDDADKI